MLEKEELVKFDNKLFANLDKLIGRPDDQGRRQGKYVGYDLDEVWGDLFISATYEKGCLKHIDQYIVNYYETHVKYLDCDVKDNKPYGNFYYDNGTEKWDGILDHQGMFSGWRTGSAYRGYYIGGRKHGRHVERDLEARTEKMNTYFYGYAEGPFSFKTPDEHTYGYSQYEKGERYSSFGKICADDYPILKKLGLFSIMANLQGHRMIRVMRHELSNAPDISGRTNYRR